MAQAQGGPGPGGPAQGPAPGGARPSQAAPAPPPASPSAPAPPPGASRSWRRRWIRLRRRATRLWLAGGIGAALIGALATLLATPVGTWLDEPDTAPKAALWDRGKDECAMSWMFPGSSGGLQAPGKQPLTAWATSHGGVPAARDEFGFQVQGTSETQVVLLQARVVVDARDAPVGGIWAGVGCGGPKDYRYLDIDLDQPSPRPVAVGVNEDGKAIDFPYQVSRGESEVFAVAAHGELNDVRWHLEIDWASDGRTGTLVVNQGGRPFRLTGTSARTARCLWAPDRTTLTAQSVGCESR
ncbi:hypothetical protein [Kitasatospora sp. NPDC088346]|uniref:hypothetical protein n=1 Tax=Kitasatospora sp. NPDC088346 TaxID=3364073 RepID=UPI0037F304D6